ncbi:MAG: hypothetical protein NVS4B8_26080 [Herpetosiphon sp.]
MLPELSRTMLERWSTLFGELRKPGKIRYLGIAGSVQGGTATFLAFPDTQREPVFAVKVHRNSDGEKRVEQERAVLQLLEDCPDRIAQAVPRLLMAEKIGKTWMVAHTMLPGQPLTACGGEGRFEADVVAVSDWLAALFHATRSKDAGLIGSMLAEARAVAQEYGVIWEPETVEQAALQSILQDLPEALVAGVGVQHRDFIRENILVQSCKHSEGLQVIDWTDSRRSGYPLHDLFLFLMVYVRQLDGTSGLREMVQAFERTFWDEGARGTLIGQVLGDHCVALGIMPRHVRALLGLFLVDQAVWEHRKVVVQSERGMLPQNTLHLALETKQTFEEALTLQPWVEFFRSFVKHGQPVGPRRGTVG